MAGKDLMLDRRRRLAAFCVGMNVAAASGVSSTVYVARTQMVIAHFSSGIGSSYAFAEPQVSKDLSGRG
jgi:hypothetical protein